jgi:hypothetical protein
MDVFTDLHVDASYVVACLLVCFYAWSRFNTPSTIRSQTSQFQYFGSCATYVVSSLGLLTLLAWVLGRNPHFLGLLHAGSSASIPDDVNSLDAALVAALMLTTLLPSFPVLRDFDTKMLNLFHKMGAIPFGAVRWAQRLDAATFTITAGPLADARNFITNSKLLPDMLIGELQPDFTADHTRFRFTRNLVLYVALSNLPNRARFGDDFPDDMAGFEKHMSRFFAQCVGFFALTDQLSRQQLEPLPSSIEEFRSVALEAYEDIRLMLARVILYSCNGEAEVAQTLTNMGFAVQHPVPIRMPHNLLSLDLIGVVTLFAASTFLASSELPVGKAIAIGLLVAVNHSIAACFALLPKQSWSFADIRCARERPVLAYVISGMCTLMIGLPVTYAFYLARVHFFPDSGPIMPFTGQCKWLLLPTVLSVALAFACDDFAQTAREPAWARWIEGLALAGLMAVTGLLVMHWLVVDQAALHPNDKPPPLWMPVVLSALIGALFGATIPNWYRTTMRRVVATDAAASRCLSLHPGVGAMT